MSSTQPSEQLTNDASEEVLAEQNDLTDEAVDDFSIVRGGVKYPQSEQIVAAFHELSDKSATIAEETFAAQSEAVISTVTALLLQKYSDEFDEMTKDRHEMGAQKYGPVKFAEVDSLQMALEEIADLANYARYTFIKVRMLQESLERDLSPKTSPPQEGKFITFSKRR